MPDLEKLIMHKHGMMIALEIVHNHIEYNKLLECLILTLYIIMDLGSTSSVLSRSGRSTTIN